MTSLVAFIHDSPDDAEEFLLASPALGLFTPKVEVGDVVTAGTVIGHLEVLHRRTPIRLPTGTPALRVTELLEPRRGAPVAYRQPLMRVQVGPARAVASNNNGKHGLDLPADAIAIQAPTDGQFFHSMNPDEEAYVVEGDTIRLGATIGSIEVMKFFYDVNFDSPIADPAAAYRIVKIVAANATPLRSGDPVAYVVPVAHLPH